MKKLSLLAISMLLFAACSTSSTNTVQQAPQVIAGNEMAAMSRLRSIVTAEFSYSMEAGGEYATLDTLIKKGLLGDPSDGKLANYRFDVKVVPGGFEATAVPNRFPISGKRSFFVDQTRVLRGADKGGSQASGSDPEV